VSKHRLALLQRIVAAAIVAFWISFGLDHQDLPAEVVDYELNFVVPDLVWITVLLLAGSYWLKKGDRRGTMVSAAAGGALVFLGSLDVLFNVRHAQYTASLPQGLLNVVVNAGCILFGLWNLWVLTQPLPPASDGRS